MMGVEGLTVVVLVVAASAAAVVRAARRLQAAVTRCHRKCQRQRKWAQQDRSHDHWTTGRQRQQRCRRKSRPLAAPAEVISGRQPSYQGSAGAAVLPRTSGRETAANNKRKAIRAELVLHQPARALKTRPKSRNGWL